MFFSLSIRYHVSFFRQQTLLFKPKSNISDDFFCNPRSPTPFSSAYLNVSRSLVDILTISGSLSLFIPYINFTYIIIFLLQIPENVYWYSTSVKNWIDCLVNGASPLQSPKIQLVLKSFLLMHSKKFLKHGGANMCQPMEKSST